MLLAKTIDIIIVQIVFHLIIIINLVHIYTISEQYVRCDTSVLKNHGDVGSQAAKL